MKPARLAAFPDTQIWRCWRAMMLKRNLKWQLWKLRRSCQQYRAGEQKRDWMLSVETHGKHFTGLDFKLTSTRLSLLYNLQNIKHRVLLIKHEVIYMIIVVSSLCSHKGEFLLQEIIYLKTVFWWYLLVHTAQTVWNGRKMRKKTSLDI